MATHSVDPKTINTKVTLKKKSGPGELIGEIEKDVQNGEVSFSGLQFDAPGEYIILAIPSAPELQQTEFTINVLPEEDVIPQDKEGEEIPDAEGDRPIIAQIDQPTIDLKPIGYKPQGNNEESTKESIGWVPYIDYYGAEIQGRNISNMVLSQDGMVPIIEVTFIDDKDIIRKRRPMDNSKFDLFLTSGSKNLKSIHLRFKITKHQELPSRKHKFNGTLDIDNFYRISFKSYNGTSFESLRNISKELGLGFNSNIKNTNDSMKWKNVGKKYHDFMYDIIEHSYISDSSYMLGYIDYYWCFNYVDIEKEWTRDIKRDVGIMTRTISDVGKRGNDSEKIIELTLTNEPSFNNTNFYISNFQILNNSTSQSIEKGHMTKIKYYDTNKLQYLEFLVDSMSTNKDEIMSLKGQPGDKEDFEKNFRTKFLGRFDSDNVHDNYKYSEIQNRINLDNLTKIVASVQLPMANFNIYKYQKIRINITNVKRTPTNDSYLDERVSGEWLIVDIVYNWARGGMTQTLKVVRKELNKIKEELSIPTEPDKTVDNSEINENPSDDLENPPNSVYEEGEVYTVRGSKDGRLYQLTIQKLSENGKEVVAKIKEL